MVGSTGAGGVSVVGGYLTDGVNHFIGPNYQVATLPVFANFSWLTTQGSATAASVQKSVVVTSTNAAGDNCRVFGMNMGAFTSLTVAFTYSGKITDATQWGLAFRESATGKLVTWQVDADSANHAVLAFGVQHWTNATTFSAFATGSAQYQMSLHGSLLWARIELTGGQTIFSYSNDGVTFFELFREAKAAFFTVGPDQWGVFLNNRTVTGTGNQNETVYSWLQV